MVQEQFVGFDVSQSETAICVVDGVGKVVWQGKCASTPEAIAVAVRRRAPHATRIALETGPMSAWHYRSLTALGLPVVCVDARHAKAPLAMQLNKTDANDAAAVCFCRRPDLHRCRCQISAHPDSRQHNREPYRPHCSVSSHPICGLSPPARPDPNKVTTQHVEGSFHHYHGSPGHHTGAAVHIPPPAARRVRLRGRTGDRWIADRGRGRIGPRSSRDPLCQVAGCGGRHRRPGPQACRIAGCVRVSLRGNAQARQRCSRVVQRSAPGRAG